MRWLLDQFFGAKIEKETDRYLGRLALSPTLASQKNAAELLQGFASAPAPRVTLGRTPWGQRVVVPLDELTRAFGLVTGGTGSGKSMFALLILKALIETSPDARPIGFGVIDPKGDLFQGALFLLHERHARLSGTDPSAAEALRRRIVILDFASRDPVSSYNVLARWPEAEPDFFASNRADLLLDLLEGGDGLSLGGTAVLQKLILLLSESLLPITSLTDVLHDEGLRGRLLASCRNRTIATYFARQFAAVPKPTLAAIERRMESFFASEGVRLALSGNTAPDFRRLQDKAKIVLVNCFGENIARSVRRLLQALVVSDIRQSVFARRDKENPFVWFTDEAQHCFSSPQLRDSMNDIVCMARSFGTYFLFLTQNIATAVQDARMLAVLHTNVKWVFAMRGDPSDCAFLKPALPVTGRRVRPQADPFAEKTFYSISEERALAVDEVARLLGIQAHKTDLPPSLTSHQARQVPALRTLSVGSHASRAPPRAPIELNHVRDTEYTGATARREPTNQREIPYQGDFSDSKAISSWKFGKKEWRLPAALPGRRHRPQRQGRAPQAGINHARQNQQAGSPSQARRVSCTTRDRGRTEGRDGVYRLLALALLAERCRGEEGQQHPKVLHEPLHQSHRARLRPDSSLRHQAVQYRSFPFSKAQGRLLKPDGPPPAQRHKQGASDGAPLGVARREPGANDRTWEGPQGSTGSHTLA